MGLFCLNLEKTPLIFLQAKVTRKHNKIRYVQRVLFTIRKNSIRCSILCVQNANTLGHLIQNVRTRIRQALKKVLEKEAVRDLNT